MKQIPVKGGLFALVDDEDFERLSKMKWYLNSKRYAISKVKGVSILMHRYILDLNLASLEVDHVNGDGLDNRKANLRICTHAQNLMNQKTPVSNTSGYKGVHWHKGDKKWHARIYVNFKKIHIGSFNDAKAAAQAYNEAAILYYGEFARINQL